METVKKQGKFCTAQLQVSVTSK